jgi:hypothetical protein
MAGTAELQHPKEIGLPVALTSGAREVTQGAPSLPVLFENLLLSSEPVLFIMAGPTTTAFI